MNGGSQELQAAQFFAAHAPALLSHSEAFQQLPSATRTAIVRDLHTIKNALAAGQSAADPYALALETPDDFRRRLGAGRVGQGSDGQPGGGQATTAPVNTGDTPAASPDGAAPAGPHVAATETLARRVGALSDEIDFPAFVAGLVHGTFDAIVDATIRQMEAFADLVSAVAKDAAQFTSENVTPNQVRDWLVQQYPRDLMLEAPVGQEGGQPRLRRRPSANGDDAESSPTWLADFGLDGQPLTDDLIEEELVPQARSKLGQHRLQMLATMVLLGMNRIVIKDGSISAKVRFRAAARDNAAVNYAVSQDPGGQTWGDRGSATYDTHSTMVSTVGVNVQSDTDLKVELFGEVKINFASETVPLDRFVDSARMVLLQRHARLTPQSQTDTPATTVASAAPTAPPLPSLSAPPAPPAPPTPPEPLTAPTPAPAPTLSQSGQTATAPTANSGGR